MVYKYAVKWCDDIHFTAFYNVFRKIAEIDRWRKNMYLWKNAQLYLTRNKIRTIIILLILVIVFGGEMIGLAMYSTAEEGEKRAFEYNGAALYMISDKVDITKDMYKKIKEIDGVRGVGNWKELIVLPEKTQNVKTHTGIDPEENFSDKLSDQMVIVAMMDIPLYSTFRWEESVQLLEGSFPDENNPGILVEEHYAEQNQLSVGDKAEFNVEEYNKSISCNICGIYQVDTDFEITEENTEGDGVYIHSPYNTIYMDYDYAQQIVQFEPDALHNAEIYLESIDNVEPVKEEIYQLFNNKVEIYNNAESYLQGECAVVSSLKNVSGIICLMLFLVGMIMLLITLSFFAQQFQYETGIYQALGESKKKCLMLNGFIMGTYIITALMIAAIIYGLSSNMVISCLNQKISDIIKNTVTTRTIRPYITHNFQQGFSFTVSRSSFFNVSLYGRMLGISFLSWIFAMALPLYAVVVAKPGDLLKCKDI